MTIYYLDNEELFPSEYLGFVDPDDYYSYDGIITSSGSKRQYESLMELVDHVNERREAAMLPAFKDTKSTIVHYLYILGEAPKHYFSKQVSTHPDRTLLADIQKGANIALSLSKAALSGLFVSGSYGWVDKNEAEYRATICASCPMNVDLKKSPTTRLNNKIAGLFTTTRTTSKDALLHDCKVCGCPLAVKVHYSDDIIKNNTKQKPTDFPELIKLKNGSNVKCWVRGIIQDE